MLIINVVHYNLYLVNNLTFPIYALLIMLCTFQHHSLSAQKWDLHIIWVFMLVSTYLQLYDILNPWQVIFSKHFLRIATLMRQFFHHSPWNKACTFLESFLFFSFRFLYESMWKQSMQDNTFAAFCKLITGCIYRYIKSN